MSEQYMPVLVGVGQVTEREFDLDSSTPLDLMEKAVHLALQDAGISSKALADLDTLVVVRSFREPTRNTPESLAGRLGADRASQWLMPNGGNGPQYLVNRFSEAIARGECRFALFTGAEAMATARRIVKETGQQPEWQEPASRDASYLIPDKPMTTKYEQNHGLMVPSGFYAMSENARRHHLGHSIEDHQLRMGRLFSRFTEVAADCPTAWYPVVRSPEEIAHPSDSNRMVAWPYTKYMNAMNQINQSAALLMMSIDHARRLGINEDRFIYLHGCADTTEKGVLARQNYFSSAAMEMMARRVFDGTSVSIDDISHIDLYSCFPIAVSLARDTFGIAEDDPRHLTVTGGLPFHGGAGNNYVMNSIATMVEKLRGDRGSYGLVTANGGYFSKHAAGIYSTNPIEGQWSRVDPASYQATLDKAPDTPVDETPCGEATIETCTVWYGRDNAPQQGTVIGRMGELDDPKASRFVAIVSNRDQLLEMTQRDVVGDKGKVSRQDGTNSMELR